MAMSISEALQLAAKKALANTANGNRNSVVGDLTGGSPNRYAQAVDEYQAQRDGIIVNQYESLKLPF